MFSIKDTYGELIATVDFENNVVYLEDGYYMSDKLKKGLDGAVYIPNIDELEGE